MIRLALILSLFLGLAVSSVASAEETRDSQQEGPSFHQTDTATWHPAASGSEAKQPRWVPRHAHRVEEQRPVERLYPTIVTPQGIAVLNF